jgi:hypothetical protein
MSAIGRSAPSLLGVTNSRRAETQRSTQEPAELVRSELFEVVGSPGWARARVQLDEMRRRGLPPGSQEGAPGEGHGPGEYL